MRKFTYYYLPPLVLLALLIGGWAALVELSGISPTVLPGPVRVIAVLIEYWDVIWDNAFQTLQQTFFGYTAALVVGFGLATVIDNWGLAKRALYPLLVGSQTIPLVAIAPLLVIWFGFDILPKVLIVTLICFFPITVSGVDGYASTDEEAMRLLRSMGASRWQIFRYLRFPAALPSFFTGIRISITFSITGSLFAEYVGGVKGLGIFIQRTKNSFRNDLVFAAIVVTAALSIALFLSVSVIQRWLMPWYFAARAGSLKSGPSPSATRRKKVQPESPLLPEEVGREAYERL